MQSIFKQKASDQNEGGQEGFNGRGSKKLKSRQLWAVKLIFAALLSSGSGLHAAEGPDEGNSNGNSSQNVNQVVQWNRTLLEIVRTHGAQPATVHPTHSFALMHAAIYDAVNSIQTTHEPYLVKLPGVSETASQDAAAAAAAHEILTQLYPSFQSSLDSQLQQSLAQIPDGPDKQEGISVGQRVDDFVLSLRSNDDAAEEATLSRIFAGVHFRFDLTAGHRLEREVADFVLDHFLKPVHPDNQDGRGGDN